MKAFKIIGIVLLVLIAVVAVASLALPTELEVSKSITINAPKEVVFNNLKSLKVQNEWSPWAEKDTNMELSFEGTEGQPGEKISWKGNSDVGTGSQEILSINEKRIETKMQFVEPFESHANAFFDIEEISENETKVTWGFNTTMDRPFNVMGPLPVFGIKDGVGKDYEYGLKKLKERSEADAVGYNEQKNKETAYTVTEVEMPQQTYISIRQEIGHDELFSFFETNMPKLYGEVEKNKLETTGSPIGVYYMWDETNKRTDVAAAVPVKAAKAESGEIKTITLPAGKRFTLDYYGDYDKSGEAHMAMEQYLEDNGLETEKTIAVEEYVVGPANEQDPDKWHTKIYYLVTE